MKRPLKMKRPHKTIAATKKPIALAKRPIALVKETTAHRKAHIKVPSSQEWSKVIFNNMEIMKVIRTMNKTTTKISKLPTTTYQLKGNCPKTHM